MSNHPSTEQILDAHHQACGADQSALYYFVYPDFSNMVLCATAGEPSGSERYWRPHYSEHQTLQTIRNSSAPFSFPGVSEVGQVENTVAVPIHSGGNVIGVSVHCFLGSARPPLEKMQQSVDMDSNELFNGWIEFLVAEQTKPLSVLFHMASTISSSLDLDRVLLSVVEQATVLFRAKMSSLMLVDVHNQELELLTAYGCSLEYLDKPNLPLDGSILGSVVRENKLLQIEDIFSEPAYLHKDHASREGVASLLAAPISFQQDVLGVLNIYSASPRRWQRSETDLLQTFANHASIAINNVRVHEQVLSMEEQLHVSAKMATMGELAAGLAHEIRNPLAVINMLIHSWKAERLDPVEFQSDLNVIAQKISDLNTLVTDLLNLARTRPLDRKMQDIRDLIDRVLRLLRHRLHQQKVTIKKNFRSQNRLVPMDRERIDQAVLNLLLNALDVTPTGGSITVETRTQDGKMAIDVMDSGPGIPEEQIMHLFKAFRTTKPTGVGLGLPMTRRIVEEHQGEIFVSRNSSSGATFTILLPLE